MKKLLIMMTACALCLSLFAPAVSAAGSIPSKVASVTGTTVHSNDKAKVDASNAAEGYVLVSYTGGKSVGIKVQIQKTGGTTYTYNLKNDGTYETFPLSAGDGDYTVKVFENVGGDKYSQAYSVTLKVSLRNEYLPFMYSNQYVSYSSDSQVVKTAAELVKGKTTALDKVAAIYEYVVNNLSYDHKRAASVKSGYVPNVDSVLKERKGICFDYAAVMSAMLRSLDIPCRMAIGYAGEIYHAWINVYIDGVGWIDKAIYFDGKSWSLMDPTFISSGKGSADAQAFVSNSSNYSVKYVY